MAFNSLQFYLFLPSAAILYYILPPRFRNLFLLLASYYFYACWRTEYVALIFISTLTTYFCARFVKDGFLGYRKFWLVLSLVINLGILFFFKYYNFFGELVLIFTDNFNPLNVLLPVGISFYTFQALGYTIDVYRNDIEPERIFIDYAVFVSFFPQLVAGPIERSRKLLPQLKTVHKLDFDNIGIGLTLVLWGLFKKIVIADRVAVLVNLAYATDPAQLNAAGCIIAACGFSVQVYCDFSAYSEIARGSAKILGFDLMRNFAAPFTASSVRGFWRKWHISLSTWFRDYLYIPLGGNRKGMLRENLNVIIVFVISGLWHGASVTYVFWGFLTGVYQVIENTLSLIAKKLKLKLPEKNILLAVLGSIVTYSLITFSFIFFRSSTIEQALDIIGVIFKNLNSLNFSIIADMGITVPYLWVLAIAILILLCVDLTGLKINLSEKIGKTAIIKHVVYFFLIMTIIIFGSYGSQYDPLEFVYFQF